MEVKKSIMLAVKLGDNGQYLFVLFEGAFGKFQMVISGLRSIIEAEHQCGAVGAKKQVGICRRRYERPHFAPQQRLCFFPLPQAQGALAGCATCRKARGRGTKVSSSSY
jgi:hypothetical protein